MAKAIVIASFGTTYQAGRASLDALAHMAQERWPQWRVVQAYTSRQVLARLERTGESAPQGLEQVLGQLAEDGCEQVYICPTHLIGGKDYQSLRRRAEEFSGRFADFSIGQPLLECEDNCRALMQFLSTQYPARPGQTILLAGHGVEGEEYPVYGRLRQLALELERSDLHVAALLGRPALSDVLECLSLESVQGVTIVPLLLMAGKHVREDLGGELPSSWRSQLEAAGYPAVCTMQGLLDLPEVRALYLEYWTNQAY